MCRIELDKLYFAQPCALWFIDSIFEIRSIMNISYVIDSIPDSMSSLNFAFPFCCLSDSMESM